MKGIAHFATGVTVSSFFPWSVHAAMEGNPLYFVLGGAFGLLPDTLDFKFYRFFYRHDVYVDPDPNDPDPQVVADTVARAIEQAQKENREVRIKLNTIRLGVDYWQQYVVHIDAAKQEVRVQFGPVVNTGQVPIPTATTGKKGAAVAKVHVPFTFDYESRTTVDIFDGPSFSIEPAKSGRVEIFFLPWHRTWSHSLLTGLFWAVMVSMIWDWRAGIIAFLAYASHVLEDQLGHMGSSLLWPVIKRRFYGLRKMHATDAIPNFLAVWTCMLLTFWNLYRVSDDPLIRFDLLDLAVYGAIIPLGAFWIIQRFLSRHKRTAEGMAESSDEWIEPMGT